MNPELPPYVREVGGAVVLAIKVQPRASRTEIAGPLGVELKIKVAAPPVDSAANEALVEFLARQLECPRRQVVLQRGQTSTHKQVAVHGMPAATVVARLAGL